MKRTDCNHTDECRYCGVNKATSNGCDACQYYRFIDSGYGWCRALPQFTLTAWCRDICSLYKEKPPVNPVGCGGDS